MTDRYKPRSQKLITAAARAAKNTVPQLPSVNARLSRLSAMAAHRQRGSMTESAATVMSCFAGRGSEMRDWATDAILLAPIFSIFDLNDSWIGMHSALEYSPKAHRPQLGPKIHSLSELQY